MTHEEIYHYKMQRLRAQLIKPGKIALYHPPSIHDDRFWATALATFAAEQIHHPDAQQSDRMMMIAARA